MIGVTPRIAFPPAWVLSHRRASEPVMLFLLKHTQDESTLDHIYQIDSRARVRRAISAHPLKSHHLALSLTPSPSRLTVRSFMTSADLYSSYEHDPATFARNVLILSKKSPGLVDRLIKRFVTHHEPALPVDYLNYLCGSLTKTPEMFDLATITASDIFAAAGVDFAQQLIKDVLYTQSYTTEPGISAEFAKALIGYISPAYFEDDLYDPGTFQSDAIDELVLSKKTVDLLGGEQLNDTQFTHYIANVSHHFLDSDYTSFFGLLDAKPDRLTQALARLEKETIEIKEPDDLSHTVKCLAGPDDPNLDRLLDRLSVDLLVDYILGRGSRRLLTRNKVLSVAPSSTSSLNALLRRVSINPAEHALALQILASSSVAIHDTLFYTLIDELPGFANAVLTSPRAAIYIYDAITGARADLDFVLDQIENIPTASLTHTLELARALALAATCSP